MTKINIIISLLILVFLIFLNYYVNSKKENFEDLMELDNGTMIEKGDRGPPGPQGPPGPSGIVGPSFSEELFERNIYPNASSPAQAMNRFMNNLRTDILQEMRAGASSPASIRGNPTGSTNPPVNPVTPPGSPNPPVPPPGSPNYPVTPPEEAARLAGSDVLNTVPTYSPNPDPPVNPNPTTSSTLDVYEPNSYLYPTTSSTLDVDDPNPTISGTFEDCSIYSQQKEVCDNNYPCIWENGECNRDCMSYDPNNGDPCPTDRCEIDSGFCYPKLESDVVVEDCSSILSQEDCNNYPCIWENGECNRDCMNYIESGEPCPTDRCTTKLGLCDHKCYGYEGSPTDPVDPCPTDMCDFYSDIYGSYCQPKF